MRSVTADTTVALLPQRGQKFVPGEICEPQRAQRKGAPLGGWAAGWGAWGGAAYSLALGVGAGPGPGPGLDALAPATAPQLGQNRALTPNSVPHCAHSCVALKEGGGGTAPPLAVAEKPLASGGGVARAMAVPQLGQNLVSAVV